MPFNSTQLYLGPSMGGTAYGCFIRFTGKKCALQLLGIEPDLLGLSKHTAAGMEPTARGAVGLLCWCAALLRTYPLFQSETLVLCVQCKIFLTYEVKRKSLPISINGAVEMIK